MRILIIYGTIEEQTRKIARAMEEHLRSLGHAVTCCNATDEPPSPEQFDMVLLGGPVHVGHYPTALKHYILANKAAIDARPNAFFSVCLHVVTGEPDVMAEAMAIARELTDSCAWTPRRIEQIAGALKYTQYDFFKRFMMKRIVKTRGGSTDTSHDHEYTDWTQVKRFCEEMVGQTKVPEMAR
ncbi:MAG TPA: flavodoxin domain-containing protein [Flavobacteriales bacterium]|nr:flavodoxin domain-containing protein [Flavobacteriales bacterium]